MNDRPLPITMLMCFYLVGCVVPCTVLFVKAIETFPEYRASASALVQSIRMLLLAAGSAVAGVTYNDTYRPIGIQTGVLVVLAALIALPFLRGRSSVAGGTSAAAH